MIDISIVSGTYNRLSHLRTMVQSVRESLGINSHFQYEIVLVDGGSTDGTINWCRSQHDIRLIEHGKLMGAVKAFNDGAAAATGRYVILANDDVFFLCESLLHAYRAMEDDPSIGVGCFFQNRGGRDWHVEYMPAVAPDGRRVSVNYGQVCIVPNWLGTHVGWWGDYLHTYGGDNELSANIIELGYKVVPIEQACISDQRVNDELRQINGGDPQTTKRHPDSEAWSKKWTRDGKTGPRIPAQLAWDDARAVAAAARPRMVYAPIYDHAYPHQLKTKRGLREALQKRFCVLEVDYVKRGKEDLFNYVLAFQPHYALFQLQDARFYNVTDIEELRSVSPNTKFINWNGDFHPTNLTDPRYIELLSNFDLATFANNDYLDLYDAAGVKRAYWQIGYEEFTVPEPNNAPKHDIVFLANGYSPRRIALGTFLDSLRRKGYNVGIYGSWGGKIASGRNLYDFNAGAAIYQNAKIAISDHNWPGDQTIPGTGFVSNRFFQAMAAGGCMLLQEEIPGMEELIGVEDGTHLGVWNHGDFQDLEEAIVFYLKDDALRNQIALQGMTYAREHFSFDARVEELCSILSLL